MTAISRYRQPSDLPEAIPVFPLRGAILLPRATLGKKDRLKQQIGFETKTKTITK